MTHKIRSLFRYSFALLCLLLFTGIEIRSQTTVITYQGKLTDTGTPATGQHDFTFKLFTTATDGSPNVTVIADDIQVTAGIFTVNLNFGSLAFTGNPPPDYFIEIAVRPGTSTGAYTTLSPRQPLTSSPYSISTIRAVSAAVADNALQLGGIDAGQYVQDSDGRLTDPRIPLAGSPNYIQSNPATQQPATNLDIGGSATIGGTVSGDVVNASTQFNIGGSRMLSASGNLNLFAGAGAGVNNTGQENAFFGNNAGSQNTGGFGNTFVGASSGRNNTNGVANTFAGRSSGFLTAQGSQNAFFGENAGRLNSSGNGNSFFGTSAGNTNTTGDNNTIIGFDADVASNNINFATAIGSGSVVSSSNSVVLGRPADTVRVPGSMSVDGPMTGTITNALEAFNASNLGGVSAGQFIQVTDSRLTDARSPTAGSANYIQNGTGVQTLSNFNISGTGTANILNAATQFDINGSRVMSVGGSENIFAGIGTGQTGALNSFVGAFAGRDNNNGGGNSFFGARAGSLNTTGGSNSFFGLAAGQNNTEGNNNSFIGDRAGQNHTTGSRNTFVGSLSNTSVGNLTNATAIGANAIVSQSNSLILGSNANVGIGTGSPTQRLHVVGNGLFTSALTVNGNLNAGGVVSNGLVRAPAGIFIANPNTLIITSPNGACWGITVNNAGVIGTFSTACP